MINMGALLRTFLILGLSLAVMSGCGGKKHKSGGGAGPASADSDDRNDSGTDTPTDTSTVDTNTTTDDKTPVDFQPDQGIKTGRQIYNTFIALTGVTPDATILAEFTALEQAMPTSNAMKSFDAGKQSAIVKLAVRFCDSAITANAATFLPGVNVNAVTDPTSKATVANLLMDKFWGKGVDSGVDRTKTSADLVKLQDDLQAGGVTSINSVKGVCTAVASAFPTILL